MARKEHIADYLNRLFAVGGMRPQLAVKISGEAEALKALEELPSDVARRVMRAALKKSQEPGISAARRAAARISTTRTIDGRAHLYETVISRIKAGRNKDSLFGTIGFTGPHSWLVEHGHRLVRGGTVTRINQLRKDYGRADKGKYWYSRGAGYVIGQVPPHPFMAPAMEEVTPEMIEIFVREVEKGTERAIKRIAKLAAKNT